MAGVPDTPLFVKTHDFLLWLIRHSQRFPKNLRHTYTQRLETALLDFQEVNLMGNEERNIEAALQSLLAKRATVLPPGAVYVTLPGIAFQPPSK